MSMLLELTQYTPIGNLCISGSISMGVEGVEGVEGIEGIEDFVARSRMVSRADLSFPIILNEWGFVMDGRPAIIHDLFDGSYRILLMKPPPPVELNLGDQNGMA